MRPPSGPRDRLWVRKGRSDLEHPSDALQIIQVRARLPRIDRLLLQKLLLHLAAVLADGRGGLRDAALLANAHPGDVAEEVEDQRALLALLRALSHDVIDALVHRPFLDAREAEDDLAGGLGHRGVVDEDRGDDLGQVSLEIGKVGFVQGGDAGLEDLGADELADRGRDGGVLIGGEIGDERAKDPENDTAAPAVAHPDGMGQEEEEWFKDGGGCETELSHRWICRCWVLARHIGRRLFVRAVGSGICPGLATCPLNDLYAAPLTLACWVEKATNHHDGSVCELPQEAFLLHLFCQIITFGGRSLLVAELLPFRTALRIHLSEAGGQDGWDEMTAE